MLQLSFLFSLYATCDHRELHSFPTRRSSDLVTPAGAPTKEAALSSPMELEIVIVVAPVGFKVMGAPVRIKALSHPSRSEEHTSELQSRFDLVCRLLLEKKKSKHLALNETYAS